MCPTMSIRQVFVLVLHIGLVLHACLSATVYSDNELFAEENAYKVDKIGYNEERDPVKTETPILTEVLKQEDSSSSEERNPQIYIQNKKSSSSESSDDSSSEEIVHKKQKRSLDSKQDSLNTIGDGLNQTSVQKESSGLDKNTHSDVLETISSNLDSSKSAIPDSKDDLKHIEPTTPTSEKVSTEKLLTEISSDTDSTHVEIETTSETDSETTTDDPGSVTKLETKLETASNNEPETTTKDETDKSTAMELSTTTETQPEAQTESESIITATTEPSSSSSPSTETDIPKEPTYMEMAMDKVNKLSDQIRLVLKYYRKEKVVVIPGQSFFPDPMPMQDFQQSFSIGTMDFKNMQVFGLSNFTVEHINTDVDRMQVYILLHMNRLVILGNYTLRTFFSRASGPFIVTLLDVDSEGVAEIETTDEGHLEATDSVMDMFSKDMKIDFRNLGFMGSMFQGMVSTVGDALFNSIKPQILERVNLVIRTDVNKKLKELSTKFINKVNPVDFAFSEGRKYVRDHGYDPYNFPDHSFVLGGLVNVNITDFTVQGLSRFYRVGNLSLSMDAGVIQIGVHVMTFNLTGYCQWSGEAFGIRKFGKTNFTVDHLQVRAYVNQSLDIRTKPQLEDLDIELGWVKVKMDSPMALNTMIEGIINSFPRLIRHIIVDALEQPLKEKIQEILNEVNIEAIVDENLPRLDNFGL